MQLLWSTNCFSNNYIQLKLNGGYLETRNIKSNYLLKKYLEADKVNKLVPKQGSHKEHTMQYATFKCECGNEITTRAYEVKYGRVKSCGCLWTAAVTKHGMWGTKEYTLYSEMIQKCHNKKHNQHHSYGGKGIKVCKKWRNSSSRSPRA